MKTLGVDLASQARQTGYCTLRWHPGECVVEALVLGADNEALIAAARGAECVGVDAPIGWPKDFVAFLAGSPKPTVWNDATRDRLRFRRTDVFVRGFTGRWPLSVSTDLIGVVALRCQTLLPHWGHVEEVYPAVALKQWLGMSSGYKGDEGAERRKELLTQLRASAPWLSMSEAQHSQCEESDHAFDALLSALVARAAQLKLIEVVPKEWLHEVATEGWIAVPTRDSLSLLP